METSSARQMARFVFGGGIVLGFLRLVLIVLYPVGLSSIFWGDPVGPAVGLILVTLLMYFVRPGAPGRILLRPDDVVWVWPEGANWLVALFLTAIWLGVYVLLSTPLLYNLPLHGVWVLPLAAVATGLQRLCNRLARRWHAPGEGASASPDVGQFVVRKPMAEPDDRRVARVCELRRPMPARVC